MGRLFQRGEVILFQRVKTWPEAHISSKISFLSFLLSPKLYSQAVTRVTFQQWLLKPTKIFVKIQISEICYFAQKSAGKGTNGIPYPPRWCPWDQHYKKVGVVRPFVTSDLPCYNVLAGNIHSSEDCSFFLNWTPFATEYFSCSVSLVYS